VSLRDGPRGHSRGSKPGDVLKDTEALSRAKTFFAEEPPLARFPYETAFETA
jgi:hypothetical protein